MEEGGEVQRKESLTPTLTQTLLLCFACLFVASQFFQLVMYSFSKPNWGYKFYSSQMYYSHI